jgi:hypothetical protein
LCETVHKSYSRSYNDDGDGDDDDGDDDDDDDDNDDNVVYFIKYLISKYLYSKTVQIVAVS